MPHRNAEAIIINCSTKEQTTLALVSALRHARLPVTVIDCESTDGSLAFFRRLRDRLPFDLAEMPLRRHGDSLDRLFRERTAMRCCSSIPTRKSCATISCPRCAIALRRRRLRQRIPAPRRVAGREPSRRRQRRLLRPAHVDSVRAARGSAGACRARRRAELSRSRRGNEIPQVPWLARLLYLRFRVPRLARASASTRLSALRRDLFRRAAALRLLRHRRGAARSPHAATRT